MKELEQRSKIRTRLNALKKFKKLNAKFYWLKPMKMKKLTLFLEQFCIIYFCKCEQKIIYEN